jgi:hypothetical protein
VCKYSEIPLLTREQETLSAEAYSFINPWLILYLLVITLVEAGLHLLILLKQRQTQRDSAKKLQDLDSDYMFQSKTVVYNP